MYNRDNCFSQEIKARLSLGKTQSANNEEAILARKIYGNKKRIQKSCVLAM